MDETDINSLLDTIDKGASVYGKIKASRKATSKGTPQNQYQPSEPAPIAASTNPLSGVSVTTLALIGLVSFLLLRR